MSKGRLEAFSDGVIAIIITIMVLELVPPLSEGLPHWTDLVPLSVGIVDGFRANRTSLDRANASADASADRFYLY